MPLQPGSCDNVVEELSETHLVKTNSEKPPHNVAANGLLNLDTNQRGTLPIARLIDGCVQNKSSAPEVCVQFKISWLENSNVDLAEFVEK